jgi:hypothetical protein
MGSSITPLGDGGYIPPLALVFRALTPVLGVLTPVADDPSSGGIADPELPRLGRAAFGPCGLCAACPKEQDCRSQDWKGGFHWSDSLLEDRGLTPDMCLGIDIWMRRLASGWVMASKHEKGPGGIPGLSGLCETLSCHPPLLVPLLLAPPLVLPPLLVLGVLMPDAEVPVPGRVAVPSCSARAMRYSGYTFGKSRPISR